MPASGAASPVFRSSNKPPLSLPEVCIAPMTPPLEQAPEGAEQAEEDEEAGEIAQDLPALLEPRIEGIEERALMQRREPLDRAHEHALEGGEQIGPDARQGRIRREPAIRPTHLARYLAQRPEGEEDA